MTQFFRLLCNIILNFEGLNPQAYITSCVCPCLYPLGDHRNVIQLFVKLYNNSFAISQLCLLRKRSHVFTKNLSKHLKRARNVIMIFIHSHNYLNIILLFKHDVKNSTKILCKGEIIIFFSIYV